MEPHPGCLIRGSGGSRRGHIVLFSYGGFNYFCGSLNNQTTLEARKWFNEKRKIGFFGMYRKFVDRFFRAYIFKQGFRDGFLGLMTAYGGGLYQVMSYAKYWEMLGNAKNKNLGSGNSKG